jgi:hypothetical protein
LNERGIGSTIRKRGRAVTGAVRACACALILGAAHADAAGTADADATFLQ